MGKLGQVIYLRNQGQVRVRVMRMVLWAAALALVSGCQRLSKTPPAAPPTPPSLLLSLEEVDRVMSENGEPGAPCDKLSAEMLQFRKTVGAVSVMGLDLNELAIEVLFLSTVKDLPNRPLPVEHWKELRGQIDRVLRGERPLPRTSDRMPEEVRHAFDRVDAAIKRGDAEAARRAMELARFTTSRWAGSIPGAEGVQRAFRIQEEFDRLTSGLIRAPIDELRRAWEQTRERIEPK